MLKKFNFVKEQLDSETSSNSSVIYLNCQGFLKNKDRLHVSVNVSKPKLLLLSKTHVCTEIELCELFIAGYQIEQCVTNNKRTGGVMALIRDDVKHCLKDVQCVQNYVRLLSLKLSFNRKKFIFTVLYHPPQCQNAAFLDFFNAYLDTAGLYAGIMVIVGDFNFDLSKPSFYGDKIVSSLYSNGFSQLVDTPTRITDVSKTLIDHVVTNDKTLSVSVHHTPRIGDHSILSISLERESFKYTEVVVYSRSMKSYNTDQLQNYLMDTEWTNDNGDVNALTNRFVESVSNVLNEMCPKRKVIFKSIHDHCCVSFFSR